MVGDKMDASICIFDIRQDQIGASILEDMQRHLRPIDGEEKKMPTMLLYDEEGLQLFENITYLEEYYLTNAEIEVLEKYADTIVDYVPRGSQLVELGSGYVAASFVFIVVNGVEVYKHVIVIM